MSTFSKYLLTFACLFFANQSFADKVICPSISEIYNKTVFTRAEKLDFPGAWALYFSPFVSSDDKDLTWTILFITKLSTYDNVDEALKEGQYEFKNKIQLSEPRQSHSYECDYYSKNSNFIVTAFINFPNINS